MARKPKLTDYGSSFYPGKRRANRVKENVLSFRCRDCKKMRYVLPRELIRAARPRCLACGGPLEETEANHERHLEKMETVRALQTGEHAPEKTRSKQPVCRSCNTKYPDV